MPALCVLDFDGDLAGLPLPPPGSAIWSSWACFHTSMRVLTIDGLRCGIVPRTIGGPHAPSSSPSSCGLPARSDRRITSAGRVSPDLPLPSVVVVDDAIRDEGTSLHYLAPSSHIAAPAPRSWNARARTGPRVAACVAAGSGPPTHLIAKRREQLRAWAEHGALAVEMQAASLFAFAKARGANVCRRGARQWRR